MVYVLIGLAVLLVISYSVYRLAKTESVGFKALAAWVSLAIIIAAIIIGWLAWRALS
jgi:hypothetical protein